MKLRFASCNEVDTLACYVQLICGKLFVQNEMLLNDWSIKEDDTMLALFNFTYHEKQDAQRKMVRLAGGIERLERKMSALNRNIEDCLATIRIIIVVRAQLL